MTLIISGIDVPILTSIASTDDSTGELSRHAMV